MKNSKDGAPHQVTKIKLHARDSMARRFRKDMLAEVKSVSKQHNVPKADLLRSHSSTSKLQVTAQQNSAEPQPTLQ
jgi:hypothetical protein